MLLLVRIVDEDGLIFVHIIGYCNSSLCIPFVAYEALCLPIGFLIQAVCHPAYAAQQSSISGVKAGLGLFTDTLEALSMRTAALSGLSQSRPLTSPVEICERNKL